MKHSFFKFLILGLVVSLTGFWSCSGDVDPDGRNGEIDCEDLDYGDTLVFIRPGQNYSIAPLNSATGKYSSTPDGLALNTDTGVIDVNASETGLKYKISFTPTGSTQVCETFLTIGGVNYLDGVFIINQNQLFVSPVYNGNPDLLLPCPDDDGTGSGSGDDNSCDFDAENPTGELLEDLGFEIDSKGVIDLEETIDNGTFGTIPVNGTILDVEMYYKINDESALALNKIPLRFFYYAKLSDVPKEVLDDIEEKRNLINESTNDKNSNFRISNTVRPPRKPRPPYIVIVASLQ